ncbi:MAG TPA: hypothetical protein VGK73_11545 [Polyangiaceae bacterium]
MLFRRWVRVAVGMLACASSAMAQTPPPASAPSAPPAGPTPPPASDAPATAPPSSTPDVPPSAPPAPPPPPPSAPPPSHGSISLEPSTDPVPVRDPRERARGPRPWMGGLGYFSIGPFFGDIAGGLESMLRSPTALGASYSTPNAGLLMGGGGGAVLFGHLWLGGKGYGLFTGSFENTVGKVSTSGSGGGFELGYVMSPHPRMLILPFLGFGGFSYALEVENKSSGNLTDETGSLVPDGSGSRVIAAPGGKREFSAGFATLEAGIRLQRLIFSRSGGFSAGLELGFLSSFTSPAWETGGYEVTNAEGTSLEGVYVRLNIGGGGFALR